MNGLISSWACVAELQSMTKPPHRSVVHAGDSLALSCRRGHSEPPPVILWYRASQVGSRRARVKPSQRVAINVDGKLSSL